MSNVGRMRIIHLDAPDIVRALASVELFDPLPRRDVEWIAKHAHILSFDEGAVVVPEGEEGLGFYVVLGGTVRLVRDGAPDALLEPGAWFGRIAPSGGPAFRAEAAADGTTCLGILRTSFKPVLVRNPRLALRILEAEPRTT